MASKWLECFSDHYMTIWRPCSFLGPNLAFVSYCHGSTNVKYLVLLGSSTSRRIAGFLTCLRHPYADPSWFRYVVVPNRDELLYWTAQYNLISFHFQN